MITPNEIQLCVDSFKEEKLSESNLRKFLVALAKEVFDHRNKPLTNKTPYTKKDLTDAANLVIEKLDRYDSKKGKAFAFVTTIMGCWYSQVHALHRRLQKMKESK